MAYYFIFAKLSNCSLEKIADNDAEKSKLEKFFSEGKSVECNATDFNNVKTFLKKCSLDSNGNVVLEDSGESFIFSKDITDELTNENITITYSESDLQKRFQSIIDAQIEQVSNYIAANSSNADTDWKTYLDKLKSINVSSLTFPIDKPFQSWFLEQEGVPNKSILQLP